jgi:CheY-like chemotaxis protein
VQQIVWNLLSNAVRFTPRGGRVTVVVDRTDSGIVISISDTGSGIAARNLPRVFERFMQVDTSTTRAHGGLGLGLAIVRHLVEAHGGRVQAESPGPGQGATFTVKLPIRAVLTRSERRRPSDAPPSSDPGAGAPDVERAPGLEGVRVLVVDDDPDSLEVLRMGLASARAAVTTAASAREAFEQIDTGGVFDLIISDIGMPEVDGYEFIRTLRARPAGPQVPAIALTAYARLQDMELSKKAGFQEHLTKPVNERLLLKAVKRWSRPAGASAPS